MLSKAEIELILKDRQDKMKEAVPELRMYYSGQINLLFELLKMINK